MPTTLTICPPALGPHLRKDRPRHAGIAQELEARSGDPFLVGGGEEIATLYGTRVVDEDVEPSETLDGHRGGRLHAFEPAQIGGDDVDVCPVSRRMAPAASSSGAALREQIMTRAPS